MVNAREHDLLSGVLYDWRTDLDFTIRLTLAPTELAPVLIALVDEGLVEVRRFTPENDVVGTYEVISPADLPGLLADPAVWDYSDRGWENRDDGLAIVETPAGQELSRSDGSLVPNLQASNPHLG
ncbi:hypothetical protein [Micromonospora sp. URMC 103]|uniref:hypothetical protein n=1 Tax=Micromonospora sp. URMC 103 TaxID=3423406 RepID=UPI003F1993D9